MKFKKIEAILTDDEGYHVLKGLLPQGSILWSRTIEDKVVVCFKDEVDLDFVEKNLNSFYRTLRL